MLTKRTNILFSEQEWQLLTTLATQKTTSVGQLVRHAVANTYGKSTSAPATHPLDRIHHLVAKHNIKGLTAQEIKSFIQEGRKY